MKKLLFILTVAGLFISSCNTSTKGGVEFNDLMEISAEGVFRGASFDMPKDEVLKLEAARTKTVDIFEDESETELIITTDMGPEAADFADVTYSFDNKGLYKIDVETYNAK
ncbi:MAG: hypothetical protein LRY27_02175 [Chitinophagales bacterium]|nr:hypothetical protein [Chitinophagales bacterium]